MKLPRRKFLHLAVGAVALLAFSSVARAQAYPSRVITVIAPFPAGGPVDTLGRVLIERMRIPLGQTIIMENVPGAGGSIGTARVARAAPDGHTLVIGNWTSHVGGPPIYPVQYDILTDFEPVARLPIAPTVIIGKKALAANDAKELVAWLKTNPDKALAGTVGAGSPSHVSGLYFQNRTGTRFQFVPYRGNPPAMQDLLSGQIDLRFGTEASAALTHIRSGQIKAFAVLSETRWAAAPKLPTAEEAGIPGLHLSFWNGLWAPKGTPRDIIDKLNRAVVETLADPAVRQRLADMGMEIPRQLTPEALGAFHKQEIDRWWPIIKAAGIKAQ